MTPEGKLLVEICGEGKTDIGKATDEGPPTEGVVPILVHTLCGNPNRMLVRSKPLIQLQGRTLEQKVRFFKRQASYNKSAAAVFVIDSDSRLRDHRKVLGRMKKARDACFPDLPMAVGAAQPCIESWLLADADAIQRAMGLWKAPDVPDEPEDLPAQCRDRRKNPKAVLHNIAGSAKAKDKHAVARAMNDLDLVRERCPASFSPFANEVQQRIRPLF